jgi:hypothetical protein
VVSTSFTFVVELMAFSPVVRSTPLAAGVHQFAAAVVSPVFVAARALRSAGPLYAGNTLYIDSTGEHLSDAARIMPFRISGPERSILSAPAEATRRKLTR